MNSWEASNFVVKSLKIFLGDHQWCYAIVLMMPLLMLLVDQGTGVIIVWGRGIERGWSLGISRSQGMGLVFTINPGKPRKVDL